MRRALEYVRAFGGVVSQHAQDPHLAGPERLRPRGRAVRTPRPARLARHRRGVDRGPRRHARPAHRLPRARRPRLDRRDRRGDPLGQGPGHRRHRRGHPAPPRARPPTCSRATTPPSRSTRRCGPQEDVDALRAALADGTIDAVATDHAPHARHDKEHAFVDAAFGMLGLETALSVVSDVMVGLAACSTGRASRG